MNERILAKPGVPDEFQETAEKNQRYSFEKLNSTWPTLAAGPINCMGDAFACFESFVVSLLSSLTPGVI